jgi:hypothetical protein
LFRCTPWGKQECIAYGTRRVCEHLAAVLQDREDDLHRPPPD